MRVVRILVPTLYEPKAGDSPKCYGQLRQRASVIEKVETNPDGTTTRTPLCGPMEWYFPKGNKPQLSDELAAAYIKAGVAEAVDEEEVRFVVEDELAELLQDVKAT